MGFLSNASHMLRPYGEVHISHKTGDPYKRWHLEELASKASLLLVECSDFRIGDYPGYNNKKGDGSFCDEPFPLGECSTFKFRRVQHVQYQDSLPIYNLYMNEPPGRTVPHDVGYLENDREQSLYRKALLRRFGLPPSN